MHDRERLQSIIVLGQATSRIRLPSRHRDADLGGDNGAEKWGSSTRNVALEDRKNRKLSTTSSSVEPRPP